jgi:multiple sugar transport system ATP-binding protein
VRGGEVRGRDISVVADHPASVNTAIRAIISAENRPADGAEAVRFALKPGKVFLFNRESEERLAAELS